MFPIPSRAVSLAALAPTKQQLLSVSLPLSLYPRSSSRFCKSPNKNREKRLCHTWIGLKRNLLRKNVIAESCGTRALTPINGSFLAGLPEKRRLTEAGLFEEQSFP